MVHPEINLGPSPERSCTPIGPLATSLYLTVSSATAAIPPMTRHDDSSMKLQLSLSVRTPKNLEDRTALTPGRGAS